LEQQSSREINKKWQAFRLVDLDDKTVMRKEQQYDSKTNKTSEAAARKYLCCSPGHLVLYCGRTGLLLRNAV
jgi:hypothetical protein